ncbi:RagB/SusD family nutrient uptake outer membrane protein [Winogradskyella vidalii]|uniref:RagB/SusD family nutrient uptake outer membrane protein n=1 Tax=Winogradskyella vidalii TaxID=2615024 RepID=UPI0015CCCE0A|nr:RagB/SusD family nutrient uptake outer membrane protein [Winogradskyella vidalii]
MKKIYKKTIRRWGVLLAIFSVLSCSDLDLLPESQVPNDGFYTNEAEIETIVSGVYDGLQHSYSRQSAPGGLWSLTDVRSDDLTILLSEGEWGRAENLNMLPTSDITLDFWQNCYLTISRTNNLIANLDVINDEGTRNKFEGEGKFVRALTYFNLVRLFGDVPLTTTATLSTENLPDLTRQSTSIIYDQIIADLSDAISLLPETNEVGRATSGAAKGILAKVYLTLGNNSSAKSLLEEILSAGYTLEPTVIDVFSVTNESNNEILFSVGYKSASNGEGNGFSYHLLIDGTGYVPTQEHMDLSPAGDRHDATLAVIGVENRTIKYDPDYAVEYEGDNDWVVLRLADIILMYAEILNEENGDANMQPAIDELNKVHAREDLAPYVLSDFANASELEQAIRDERRFELAFEGHRWFDLQRYGNLVSVMSNHLGVPVTEDDLLLPIPQREIDVSQGVITQNSGY